jgi:hypothetical protein
MPRGGDGAACPAALPDKGRWVPRPVTLARKRAQEATRHAPTCPLVSSAEASSPEPDVAFPQGKGARGTTAVEPLGSEGGATGDGEAGGACVLPLAQFSAPCAVSPCIGSPGGRWRSKQWSDGAPSPRPGPVGHKQPRGGPACHLISRFFPTDAGGSSIQALGSTSPGAV